MSHLIAMLIASSGIALTTAGPNCALCADKGADKSADKSSMCCGAGDCEGCQEKKAKAYESAEWPAHNTDLYANDLQGKPLPVALGTETWLSDSVDTDGKVVVLDFWATWCPPCRAASPILDELQKENPDSLAVLAIAGQRDPQSDVQSYIDEHPVAYANLYSDDQAVYNEFESKGIPQVVHRWHHPLDREPTRRRIPPSSQENHRCRPSRPNTSDRKACRPLPRRLISQNHAPNKVFRDAATSAHRAGTPYRPTTWLFKAPPNTRSSTRRVFAFHEPRSASPNSN